MRMGKIKGKLYKLYYILLGKPHTYSGNVPSDLFPSSVLSEMERKEPTQGDNSKRASGNSTPVP